jgi:hypothetical protein
MGGAKPNVPNIQRGSAGPVPKVTIAKTLKRQGKASW